MCCDSNLTDRNYAAKWLRTIGRSITHGRSPENPTVDRMSRPEISPNRFLGVSDTGFRIVLWPFMSLHCKFRVKDAAPLLGISLATAKRRWAFARVSLWGTERVTDGHR